MEKETILIFVILPIITLLISYGLVLLTLKKLRKKRILETEEKLSGKTINYLIPAANSFGQESLGLSQIRGVGTLAFLEDEIFFLMWLPKKELRIPLRSILAVETVLTHLAKSKLRELLKVTFINEKNERDSIAWHIKNLSEAKEKLVSLWKTATE